MLCKTHLDSSPNRPINDCVYIKCKLCLFGLIFDSFCAVSHGHIKHLCAVTRGFLLDRIRRITLEAISTECAEKLIGYFPQKWDNINMVLTIPPLVTAHSLTESFIQQQKLWYTYCVIHVFLTSILLLWLLLLFCENFFIKLRGLTCCLDVHLHVFLV